MMKVTWIGHACFKVESEGISVIFDPYEDESVPGIKPLRERANLVCCSHEHDDHNARKRVELIGAPEGAYQLTVIDTFHDHHKGAHRGLNKIHILETGGYKIAHLGDLGCELSNEQKEGLKGLDLLLCPVGGTYTIDAEEAKKLVDEIKPVTVIPMHYRDDKRGTGYDVTKTVDDFVERMDAVTVLEDSVLHMEKRPEAQVVVLQPREV